MSKNKFSIVVILMSLALVMACEKLTPLPNDNEVLDGPVEGLSSEQHIRFLRGDVAFNEVFTKENGLGSLFVATSCGSCHAGDGKGHPFTMLTRFGQSDTTSNQYLQHGGPQLQHRALPGFMPEQIPAGATSSNFMPPANTGLGFLDAVPDAAILAMADPNDANGDGISGRPNWVTLRPYISVRANSISNNGAHIGRFGKKAAAYDLLQQTASAYNQDMGISSFYEPSDPYSGEPIDPEVTNVTVQDVVFYLKTLKQPLPRNQTDADVVAGKQRFVSIGCGKCHVPSLTTGHSDIAPLSNVEFFPYTDLLLHDMGSVLNDGYTEGKALPEEWRTPPLWGLGLSKDSQGGSYFLLHDGRAKSIEEAITMHGGEGQQSNMAFQLLTLEEKKQLIKFLESL